MGGSVAPVSLTGRAFVCRHWHISVFSRHRAGLIQHWVILHADFMADDFDRWFVLRSFVSGRSRIALRLSLSSDGSCDCCGKRHDNKYGAFHFDSSFTTMYQTAVAFYSCRDRKIRLLRTKKARSTKSAERAFRYGF